LGFLGAVQESEARKAWALIDGFSSFRCVEGTFEQVKPLGHPRKPSALSAIVASGRDELSEMVLEARAPLLAAADARPDERPPLPHMTLARIQRRANAAERREALRWAEGLDLRTASFRVDSVALYTWSAQRELRLFDVVERHGFAP
jgi:2'-5' RNA ligase